MFKDKYVLVTGGAGYIGSYMVRVLLDQGIQPVVMDNLSMGHRVFVPAGVPFIEGDLRSRKDVQSAFEEFSFIGVMHFGALALVQESVEEPKKYHDNNVTGTENLISACVRHGVGNVIFSSTCSVYGDNEGGALLEDRPLLPKNPYGETKLLAEGMIRKILTAQGLKYTILRYFNACGAHPSGEIGEWHEPETHLIPNVFRAATEGRPLVVFGCDYPTPDGTCVRDYIDVGDICHAHWLALQALMNGAPSSVYNLGSGSGISVKELIRLVEDVTGMAVPFTVGPRRSGDPAVLVADATRISQDFGWRPAVALKDSIAAAWRWERDLRGRMEELTETRSNKE